MNHVRRNYRIVAVACIMAVVYIHLFGMIMAIPVVNHIEYVSYERGFSDGQAFQEMYINRMLSCLNDSLWTQLLLPDGWNMTCINQTIDDYNEEMIHG